MADADQPDKVPDVAPDGSQQGPGSDKPFEADTPFFRARLTPHRSLGRTGFLVLMGALLAAWAVTALFFLARGLWPVAGFFGLDVLGVYIAFRLNYRAGREAEEVAVSRTALAIRKTAPSGKSVEHRMNPFWARLHVRRHAEIGVTGISVEARGERVAVGGFLNPDDRETFADAFSKALATARAG